MKIIPLGTVSPYCNKNSNCPGFLIKYKDHNILLDCGNGITRLLDFPTDLKNLHIFISHLHKDHLGDITSIQYASYVYKNLGLIDKKINIYLPKENEIRNLSESYANYFEINESSKYKIDDLEITFYNNKSHAITSYVIILKTDTKKIVYTSDIGNTNLCELSEIVKESNILICESSFIKKHNAKSSTHLHAHEAATLAKNSNVKKLVLTHFWPEEDKNNYLKEALEIFENTIVAIEEEVISI